MANAAARRAAKAKNVAEDGITVTAVTEVAGFEIEELGEYNFTRQGAGRKREPSPFDDVIEKLVGKGTQRIHVADEEAGKVVIRDLQKATDFHKRGLEKRNEPNEETGGWQVVFRVNEAKAARAPRKSKAEEAVTDAAENAETE
jgi:hypothetical protein